MPNCKNCQKPFTVANEDQEFYKKIDVSSPTFCPWCRQQRRLSFRNEINLHQRKCDKTGKQILSMYSANAPYTVYDQDEWWKDTWDPMEYGRDFDFSKPFFEQFAELQKKVPRMSLNCIGNENSYYTNYSYRDKDAYLVFTADFNENSYYLRFSDRNFNSCDCDLTYDSTCCYECIDIHKCNQCMFSQKCDSSSNLFFCYDMRNCHNCLFSANLRNKEYFVFNEKVAKDEFEKIKNELKLSTYQGLEEAKKKAVESLAKHPRKYLEIIHCEDCLGDYLKDSKNTKFCFDSYNLQDVKYGSHLYDAKDCYDWDFVAAQGSELCYEMASSAYNMKNCRFTMNSWEGNSNLTYCDLCLGNENLFGCISLRKKKYCILNKQYTKAEYEHLVPKIIEHMKKTGEWGEFFPISISPFGYNESVAFEYYPMTREEALSKGYKWEDEDKKEYRKQNYTIPGDIKDVKDNIKEEVLACETCGKNYKITMQELDFYKKIRIPIPHKCYNCRHKERMAKRNPRILYKRECSKCGSPITTTYAPKTPVPVYCEKCYYAHVD